MWQKSCSMFEGIMLRLLYILISMRSVVALYNVHRSDIENHFSVVSDCGFGRFKQKYLLCEERRMCPKEGFRNSQSLVFCPISFIPPHLTYLKEETPIPNLVKGVLYLDFGIVLNLSPICQKYVLFLREIKIQSILN